MELYPTLYLYFKLSMNQRVKMFLDHTIYCNNRKKTTTKTDNGELEKNHGIINVLS